MEDLITLIENRARDDGLYAIAYAILLVKEVRPYEKSPFPLNDTLLKKVTLYLSDKRAQKICCIQLWIECLGRQRSDYTLESARLMARMICEVPGWVRETPRFTQKYGKQKVFAYFQTSDDLDTI